MFFWFVAAAVLLVLFVFDSPAVDYRWVAFGGVLPLAEALTGRPWILHTLLGSVLLLALVMVFTVGRRLARRAWLGVPIGTFAFDAIGVGPLPEYDRPFGVLIVIELGAIAGLVVIGRRLGLDEAEHRRNLLATGRVPKERLR